MEKGVKAGLIFMVFMFVAVGVLMSLDPTVVSKVDTGNPRTNMNVTEHILTGQKDYV